MFCPILLCGTLVMVPPLPELMPGPGARVFYDPIPEDGPAEIEARLREIVDELRGNDPAYHALHELAERNLPVLKGQTSGPRSQEWLKRHMRTAVWPKLRCVQIWFDRGTPEERRLISDAIAEGYEATALKTLRRHAEYDLITELAISESAQSMCRSLDRWIDIEKRFGTDPDKLADLLAQRETWLDRSEQAKESFERQRKTTARLDRTRIHPAE